MERYIKDLDTAIADAEKRIVPPTADVMPYDHVENVKLSSFWNQRIMLENRKRHNEEEYVKLQEALDNQNEFIRSLTEEVYNKFNGKLRHRDAEEFVMMHLKKSGKDETLMQIVEKILQKADELSELNLFSNNVDNPAIEESNVNMKALRNSIFKLYQNHMSVRSDYMYASECREKIIEYTSRMMKNSADKEDIKRLLAIWLSDSEIRIHQVEHLKAFIHYIDYRANMMTSWEYVNSKAKAAHNALMNKITALVCKLSKEEKEELRKQL